MGNKIVGERIEYRRKELGLTLDDIAQEIGVAKSTIQRYEKGTITAIKLPVIEAIARLMSVSPAWLCGKTDSIASDNLHPVLPSNVVPLSAMKKVPLIGEIACGQPILAEQNIEEMVDLPQNIRADYALTCKGDSMINAGIQNGDIVYIRMQETVENGQIAAVRVGDDEATLKRFYFDGNMVQLIAENTKFEPMAFVGEQINEVHILGLAVGYTHAFSTDSH
ncbi:transcriptional repressor LexA [Oscillospiraceae bacterium 42-9]